MIALFYEKPLLNFKFWKFKDLLDSKSANLFPANNLTAFSLLLFTITILFSFVGGIHLNIISSLGISLITLNLFQFKNFIFLDWIVLAFFYAVCFITLNGILLNSIIPKFFYVVFIIIPIGGVFFILRILWSYLKNTKWFRVVIP